MRRQGSCKLQGNVGNGRFDKGRRPDGVDRFRLLKAVAVVLAIMVMAPGVDTVARVVAAPQKAAAAGADEVGVNAARLLDAADAFGSLERIEEAAEAAQTDAPEVFSREVGLAAGAYDIRVSPTGDVIGYMVEDDCEAVLQRERARMESLGWNAVPLGGEQGLTFVKPSGDCTWVLVTCTQVGTSTSVVARCVSS